MVVNTRFDHWNLHGVVCDYEAAGRLAADYLADLGHRRIGHIAGPASVVATIRDLSEAFTKRLEERGIRLTSNMIVEGQLLVETGRFAAAELLRRDPKLTAIFAANDKMALGAYQAIREAGKSPGKDVAVIGCDDIPTAALADPPLTTVRMNYVEVGAMGARRLLERIESNGSRDGEGLIFEKLPVALAARDSCCRPPA
jgi:LacI family transcriptional regulator